MSIMKKVIVVKANGAKVVKVSARKAVEERELPITETPKSYNEVSVEFMVNYIADHEETAGTWYDALDANIQNNITISSLFILFLLAYSNNIRGSTAFTLW